MGDGAFRDVRFTAPDGLKLYARDYPADGKAVPVLCLCGLTRNSRDFEPLAQWLAGTRRLVVMDYRGRGKSAYAPDPATYRPDVEMADAIALLNALAIPKAAIIGTSRGGIVAMLMAAQMPQRIAGVLLNDIGPVIEAEGLLRIRSYIGASPILRNWQEAVAALKLAHPGFESLAEDQWLAYAGRIYREDNGLIRADYDPRLADNFPSVDDITSGLPDLWPLFASLLPLPVTVLRAEHSDLLSAATIAEMRRRHPRLKSQVVKDRGHVPFLDEPDAVEAVDAWLGDV